MYVFWDAEEREKPELLAESRERRIRVAEESGKTEQEVKFCSILMISPAFDSLQCSSIPNSGANEIVIFFSRLGESIGCPAFPNACSDAEVDGYGARTRSNSWHGRSHGLA